jgi:myb proto-oncogene protein
MRLQGLYSAFGCSGMAGNAPPQWPNLESPTDAVATTALSAHHQPQSLVAGHALSAAEADQLNSSAGGASYEMPAPGSFERSKLGFCSPAGEASDVSSSVEMSSEPMVGGGFGYGHVDELYDFLYSKQLAAAGGFQGGVPPLPELQCPDGGAVVGADEKFSTWMASCDYVPTNGAGQLQLQGSNSMNLQDFVLGYDQ